MTTEEHLEFRHRVTPAPTRYLRRMHFLSDDANGIVVKYNSTKQMNLIRWKRAEWIAYWEMIGCYDHLNIDDDALLDLARTRVMRTGPVWKNVATWSDANIRKVKARAHQLFGLHIKNEAFPDFILEYFEENGVRYRNPVYFQIYQETVGEITGFSVDGDTTTVTAKIDAKHADRVKSIINGTYGG